MPPRWMKREEGQTLVVFAFMLTALMGLIALSVDIGLAYREKQSAQSASDAAALAAAGVLRSGGDINQATTEAEEIAEANGYVDGVDGVRVYVTIPPDSGPYAGRDGFAEVEIDSASETEFAHVFNLSVFGVSTRAVAGGVGTTGAFGIVALNPTDCKSLLLNGTIAIEIVAAGIFVNSDCPTDAFWAVGNVSVDTEMNAVVGGWGGEGSIEINPVPVPADSITDPLAGLPVPVPPTNVQPCPDFQGQPGTVTLPPGRYDCQIDPTAGWGVIFQPGDYHITGGVVADGGGSMTFNSGVYTLGGVGVKVTGSGSITVNHAMLYIDEGEVELTGNGITRLIAPDSGTYAGIVIFQNRDLTTQLDLKGTSLTAGIGSIYAKAATISLVGNSASSNIQFISDKFAMSGAASVELDWEDNVELTASFLRLVE